MRPVTTDPKLAGGPALAIHAAIDKAPDWIQFIPAGTFRGRDGRGPYENLNPDLIVEATRRLGMDGGIPLDYDHATDYAAPNGGEAPAAGWICDLKVTNGQVWGKVEWTPEGAKRVANKHWKYVSPVFEYVERQGKAAVITCLLRAALTNNPNIKELPAIAAARLAIHRKKNPSLVDMARAVEKAFPDFTTDQAIQMIEFAERLRQCPENPEDVERGEDLEQIITHLDEGDLMENDAMSEEDEYDAAMAAEAASMLSENDASANKMDADAMAQKIMARAKERRMAARQAKKDAEAAAQASADAAAAEAAAQAAPCPSASDPHAALRSLFPHLSDEKIQRLAAHARASTAPVAASDTSDKVIMALTTQVNNLTRERAVEKATAAVDDAIKDFRLTPAQRDWAIGYATKDIAGFSAFVSKQAQVVSNDPTSTGLPTPAKVAAAAGSVDASTRAICANLGLTTEKFVEHREANKTNRASMAFQPSA